SMIEYPSRSTTGGRSSVLPELWDSKPRNGGDVFEVQLQLEGLGGAEIQGDHADDEQSAGWSRRAAGDACGHAGWRASGGPWPGSPDGPAARCDGRASRPRT